ncbi:MAG: hypothetical protein ABF959_05580 [Gluconobacter albidus]
MTQKDPTNHLGLNDGHWHDVQAHHARLSAPDYEFRRYPTHGFLSQIRSADAVWQRHEEGQKPPETEERE